VYAFGAQPVNFPRAGLDPGSTWADQAYLDVAVGRSLAHDPEAHASAQTHHYHVRMADLSFSALPNSPLFPIVAISDI
jgi:hypothetical protein